MPTSSLATAGICVAKKAAVVGLRKSTPEQVGYIFAPRLCFRRKPKKKTMDNTCFEKKKSTNRTLAPMAAETIQWCDLPIGIDPLIYDEQQK